MSTLKIVALALGSLGLSTGLAQAQTPPSDPTAQPSMATPGGHSTSIAPPSEAMPPPPPSAMDVKTMQACGAMSHAAMMASPTCKLLIAQHPEMMNPDGTMKAPPVTPR